MKKNTQSTQRSGKSKNIPTEVPEPDQITSGLPLTGLENTTYSGMRGNMILFLADPAGPGCKAAEHEDRTTRSAAHHTRRAGAGEMTVRRPATDTEIPLYLIPYAIVREIYKQSEDVYHLYVKRVSLHHYSITVRQSR